MSIYVKKRCFLQEKVGVLSRGQNAYFILQSSKFESEPNILIYCTINFLRRYGFDKCDVPLPSFTGIVLSAVWLEFHKRTSFEVVLVVLSSHRKVI